MRRAGKSDFISLSDALKDKMVKKQCHSWMVDRLEKDGCPSDEAEKYDMNEFVTTFYESDWCLFVEDSKMGAIV